MNYKFLTNLLNIWIIVVGLISCLIATINIFDTYAALNDIKVYEAANHTTIAKYVISNLIEFTLCLFTACFTFIFCFDSRRKIIWAAASSFTFSLIFVSIFLNYRAHDEFDDVDKVNCPAPQHCAGYLGAYNNCLNSRTDLDCNIFIEYFQKLLPTFDCQRPKIVEQPVPAIWLCHQETPQKPEDVMFYDAVELLFSLDSKAAKELSGSKLLQAALSGETAETFLEKSEQLNNLE